MFILVQVILVVVVGTIAFYLFLLTIAGFFVRWRVYPESEHKRRFAVLIPAHDEEQGIGATIRSVLAVDYPQELREVIVIADNCTDNTASVAAQNGATVLIRTHATNRSKGYALRWAFDQLVLREEYDAFVVVDADSTVSNNYLRVLNAYREVGARAIQTADLVVPPGENAWNAQMTRIGFLLGNLARPLGRKAIGGTVGLRGNGMCLERTLVREVPWESYSLAEDLEHGLRLLLRDVSVAFAPEATVFAIMPEETRNAESQRARWEGGRYPVIKQFAIPILKRFVRTRAIRELDAFLDLITPALVNLGVMVISCTLLTAAATLLGIDSAPTFLSVWLGLLAAILFHLFVGLILARADASVYRSLLKIPRYALWKLGLYLRMMGGRRGDQWIRTTREKS